VAKLGGLRLGLVATTLLMIAALPARAGIISLDFDGSSVTSAEASTNTGIGSAQLPAGVADGAPIFATVTYDTSSTGSPSVPGSSPIPPPPSASRSATVCGWRCRRSFSSERRMGQISSPSRQVSPARRRLPLFRTRSGMGCSPAFPFSQRRRISSTARNCRPGRSIWRSPTMRAGISSRISCECLGTGPGPDANYQIAFSITSMTEETAIPEPSALASFGTVLLVLAWLGPRPASQTAMTIKGRGYP
jgi:hypothetical protein